MGHKQKWAWSSQKRNTTPSAWLYFCLHFWFLFSWRRNSFSNLDGWCPEHRRL